ncbi:MAG: hypothetical protein Q9195_004739 [Heterodermia aff. obscurata]
MEPVPGASRAHEAAIGLDESLHAVPQHEELYIEMQDGKLYFLKRCKYQPLTKANEIRLLRVHPRSSGLTTINNRLVPRYELVHTTLDGETEYTAISYAWGKLNDYAPVLINEADCLMVTRSLFEALCKLSMDHIGHLWVDQICIDQYNVAERNQQVQIMGEIFGKASRTFVWLGMADETTQSAFDLIETLARSGLSIVEADPRLRDDVRSHLQNFISCQGSGSGYETEKSRWVAMRKLSNRPWFTRLWTFQEVVTSKVVVFLCGEHSCTDVDLLLAFFLVDAEQGCRTRGIYNTELAVIHRGWYLSGRWSRLIDLLLATSHGTYDCALPHDRIYALLALQDPQQRSMVPVDYHRSIQSLYTEVASMMISSTQNLRLLPRRRYNVLEGLPSWVPDWSCPNEDPPIDGTLDFSCSKNIVHISEESAPQYLLTRGNVVAQITRIAAHRFPDLEQEYHQRFRSWFRDHGRIFRSWFGDHGPIPFIVAELNKRSDLQHYKVEKKRYIKWLIAMTVTCGRFHEEGSFGFRAGNTGSYSDLSTIIASYGQSYCLSLMKCARRRLAVLDKYPLGLVPEGAEPGDLVCVLHGSSTPIILRRVEKEFEVIGECYVHGIMYGEAVNWSEGNKFLLR